jgi:hypothetical protein
MSKLEPVINFIPFKSSVCRIMLGSLTMEGWEIRGKSAIPAM